MTGDETEKHPPVVRLTDDELKTVMQIHIRIGCILKNPGVSQKEVTTIVDDIINSLTIDQMRVIHPCLYSGAGFKNQPPKNPYLYALELLSGK